ncbi:ankyrin [Aaosphaeria arxii CBS 175.79]|uniref:Ankyrin n=1 Tax=Aaosphaeria arxii CBS 175.79 TaxID=1450172 RepID=A0A6A5Y8Z6_9PLEO|nr:ankyrin [Aaosphaeria arxii CBS 175.79]KAF2021703.1 ankyrin [Aaosphaeria arxii CBS 175.79]
MDDTAASITATAPSRVDDGEMVLAHRPFDILAFLALAFRRMDDIAKDALQQYLSRIFLDDELLSYASSGGSGGSFSVSVIRSKDIEDIQIRKQQQGSRGILPESVAVRVAKLAESVELRQTQKMLYSMAKEIAVLTNDDIRACNNIVRLLGACWSYSNPEKSVLLPVLVYEAAPLGDLDKFLDSHKRLPLGHQLQLCIDIATGVEKLHRVGVVHCDIKPKNILVFPTNDVQRPYRAKIADFGCAILLDDVDSSSIPPQGTRFWNPPEQLDLKNVAKEDLHKIDVFSLGLVLLGILTSDQSTRALTYIQSQKSNGPPVANTSMGLDYFKRWGSLSLSAVMILERFSNLTVTQRSSVKEPGTSYFPPHLLDDETLTNYSTRWNEQAASIVFQALQGDISRRSVSVRKIVCVLEGINTSVEIHGQRDHIRVDLGQVVSSESTTVQTTFVMEVTMARAWPFIVKEDSQYVALPQSFPWNLSRRMNQDYTLPRIRVASSALKETDWEDFIFGASWDDLVCGTSRDNKQYVQLTLQRHIDDVVKLTNYLANMTILPGPLLDYVMRSLGEVSDDIREPMERRTIAAYELALGLIAFVIVEDDDEEQSEEVSRALQLLKFAVQNGHEEAQWTVGWMYTTFNQQYPDDDTEWLVNGMISGSRIASRRLQVVNPERFDQTRQIICDEYQGIGKGWHIEPEWLVDNAQWFGQPIPDSNHIVLAASAGDLDRVKDLIANGCDIDSRDGMQETPLIAACRAGQYKMVVCLVAAGADVTLVSKENISALHFLSSFNHQDIPFIGLLLRALGCPLESHSTGHTNLNNGYTGADRFYGICDGTPLLWAVAAGCLPAVKVLLGLGADPFDVAGGAKDLQHSPVNWASQMHQIEILELLLDTEYADLSLLNTSFRMNNVGNPVHALPLAPAASYSGGLVFYRIQLHNNKHRENCRRTIELLLSKGADPQRVNSRNMTAFHYAGTLGQPYALHALFGWQGSTLRPDIKQWTGILINAAAHNSKHLFNELLKVDVQTNEEYSWPMIISELAGQVDAKYYLNALITHHEALCTTAIDLSQAFENALINNHFDNARIIFERASRCDIVATRHDSTTGSSQTLLGRLMRRALLYPSNLAQVKAFLKLTGGRDVLFASCWNTDAGEYNALQVAVAYTPHGKTRTITTGLLETILAYFKHPVKHLNTTQGEKKKSLLHLAVRFGNAQAVEMLLNLDGLDLSVRDTEGGTAFDRALNRLQDTSREKELALWEVPESELEKAREDWDDHTRTIILVMEAKGASMFSTYSHVFKRLTTDRVRRWMVFPDDGRIEVTDFSVSNFERGPLLDRCAALPIGRCFYLCVYQDPSSLSMFAGAITDPNDPDALRLSDILPAMQEGGT